MAIFDSQRLHDMYPDPKIIPKRRRISHSFQRKPPSPVSKFHQKANSKRAKPIPSLGNCPKAKAVSGLPTFIMILDVFFFVGLKRDV